MEFLLFYCLKSCNFDLNRLRPRTTSILSNFIELMTLNGNNVVDDCGIIANHYMTERFSGIENQTRSPTNNINNFNIIAISESRLNTTVINAEVKIAGYKLSRLDRLTKQGGGV